MKNKIKITSVFILLIVMTLNVFGLSFNVEVGGSSVLPDCSENEFLIYSSSGWVCQEFTTGSGGFDLDCANGQTVIYNNDEWGCINTVVDTNTQLSENEVDNYVSDNGYLTSYTDTNTQLSESEVDDYVSDNGYLTSYTDTNTQLSESEVDNYVSNNGYLTSYIETDSIALSMFTNYYNESEVDNLINEIPTVVSGGYFSNLYTTLNDSDLAGYKVLSYELPNDEYKFNFTTSTIGSNYLGGFVYQEEIGVDYIEAGYYLIEGYSKVDSLNGDTQFRIEFFMLNDDSTKQYLFNTTSESIESEEYIRTIINSHQNKFSVNSTARIGFDVYIERSLSLPIEVSFIIGDGRASFISLPLSLRHDLLRGLNDNDDYQHINSTEKNFLNSISDTYLFNKSCSDGEQLQFNETSNSWNCKTIIATIPENITVSNINFDYGNLTSKFTNITTYSLNDSVLTFVNMTSSVLNGGLSDKSENVLSVTNYGSNYDSDSSSYYFNGGSSGDYILVDGSEFESLSTSLTISIWGKKDSIILNSDSDQFLFLKRYSSSSSPYNTIGISADDGTNNINYILSISGTQYSTSVSVSDTDFHMYSITYDGTNIKYYLDDTLIDTINVVGSISQSSTYDIGIGEGAFGGTDYFTGYLSSFLIYENPFNATEIKDLFDLGRTYNSENSLLSSVTSTLNTINYFSDKVSATGYITRTPTDLIYLNSLDLKINHLPNSKELLNDAGILKQEYLFSNEKVIGASDELGHFQVDGVVNNNRIMIVELKNEIDSLKNELCNYNSYVWCNK